MNDTVDDAGEELLSLPVQAAFATSMAIFFLVDILGNSLVILAIITNPKLQSTSNLYLFALAVTDISIGKSSLLEKSVFTNGKFRSVQYFTYHIITSKLPQILTVSPRTFTASPANFPPPRYKHDAARYDHGQCSARFTPLLDVYPHQLHRHNDSSCLSLDPIRFLP